MHEYVEPTTVSYNESELLVASDDPHIGCIYLPTIVQKSEIV